MFNLSKYTNYYFQIINSAINSKRIKSKSIYYESHHIIPKSLGGSNKIENLVLLTPREHFICHWLLTKMVNTTYEKQKMVHAFSGMYSWKEKRQLSSKQYEILKTNTSKRKHSIESNKKRSIALKGRISPNKGKIMSEEQKLKISIGGKGKNKNGKKCSDGINTYYCVQEMAKALGLTKYFTKKLILNPSSPHKLIVVS